MNLANLTKEDVLQAVVEYITPTPYDLDPNDLRQLLNRYELLHRSILEKDLQDEIDLSIGNITVHTTFSNIPSQSPIELLWGVTQYSVGLSAAAYVAKQLFSDSLSATNVLFEEVGGLVTWYLRSIAKLAEAHICEMAPWIIDPSFVYLIVAKHLNLTLPAHQIDSGFDDTTFTEVTYELMDKIGLLFVTTEGRNVHYHIFKRPLSFSYEKAESGYWAHNEAGPVLTIADQSVWAVKGQYTTNNKDFAKPSSQWRLSKITSIQNVELRKALINTVGLERYVKHLDGKLIHTFTLKAGGKELPYELYEFDDKDMGKFLGLRMKNPSVPGMYHFEFAPINDDSGKPMRTCEEVLLWRGWPNLNPDWIC